MSDKAKARIKVPSLEPISLLLPHYFGEASIGSRVLTFKQLKPTLTKLTTTKGRVVFNRKILILQKQMN